MTLVLSIILLLSTISCYTYINIMLNKYSKKKVSSKLSGFEVARKILDNHDLNNVYITETKEFFFNSYDSKRKVIRLKDKIFNESSLSSTVISSLEAVHCIQDKKNNKLVNLKNTISSFVNYLMISGYIIICFGIIFGHINTILAGLLIEYIILIYNLCIITIEKDAHKIVLVELIGNNIVNKKELIIIEKLLNLLNLSCFSVLVSPVIEFLKKIIMFGRSNK